MLQQDDWSNESIIANIEVKFPDRIYYKNLGRSVSCDKLQAGILCDIMEEFLFKQFIRDPTRKNNILDLFFCNDFNLVEEYQIIENIFYSDQCSIVIETNINNMKEDDINEYVNHYSTEIPNYETLDTSPEEWNKLNDFIFNID